MINELEKAAIERGDRLKVISIKRLKDLEDIIETFKDQEGLSDFQKWIVTNLYSFKKPEESFAVNSIILMAVHHPFYARVNFHIKEKMKTFLSLVRSDFAKTEAYIKNVMEEKGYSIKLARNLPLKRLGTHSGLAKYGRNNITYIDGLGSNFSYTAYFSDLVCDEDTWGEVENAECCNECNLCTQSCPTGAINKDRFLIDNQKCLSLINEVPGEIPTWIPVQAHHALYDCLFCQHVCPMNHGQEKSAIECISFTEEETNMLLNGEPIDTFPIELKTKAHILGITDWYEAIPRNLKILFEQ